MEHDIHDFIKKAQGDLQAEYLRIRKRATEDPGTAGDQGEENWATLLREWLPNYFHIVTKGRILTDSGYASPQVDVLILYPSYPKILLDKKLYLSGGVAAAFECKTTLNAAHVKDAINTCSELKRSLPKHEGSPYKELHAGIIYGLLAHSHSWKNDGSKPIDNIEEALWSADSHVVKHPRECIDFISVSDLATWQVMKLTYLNPLVQTDKDGTREIIESDGAHTTYICHAIDADSQKKPFSPIGTLLSGLFSALAWSFPDMRQLEEYFRKVDIVGGGKGQVRLWNTDIYSSAIRDRIRTGKLAGGFSYNEWSMLF